MSRGQLPVQVFPGSAFVAVNPARHSFRSPSARPAGRSLGLPSTTPTSYKGWRARGSHRPRHRGCSGRRPGRECGAPGARDAAEGFPRSVRGRARPGRAGAGLRALSGKRDESQGGQLLEEVRARVVRGLPEAIDVNALARDYGMSRTRFCHFPIVPDSRPAISPPRSGSTRLPACCSTRAFPSSGSPSPAVRQREPLLQGVPPLPVHEPDILPARHPLRMNLE